MIGIDGVAVFDRGKQLLASLHLLLSPVLWFFISPAAAIHT